MSVTCDRERERARGWRGGAGTFSTGVRLHELVLRACFGEFRGKPGQLRQDFVDETNFRGEVVLVDM